MTDNRLGHTTKTPTNNDPQQLLQLRQEVADIIQHITGNKNVVMTYTLLIDFFDRDINAAILLNQILYWTDRAADPDGWFYKTYDDWYNELRFSEYQVTRVIRGDERVKNPKRNLWSVGLETQVRMAPNGRNAVFYNLNKSAFLDTFTDWLQDTFQLNIAQVLDALQAKKTKIIQQTIFNNYQKPFGKLDHNTRKILWAMHTKLGEEETQRLLEDCKTTCSTWQEVIEVFRRAIIDSQTTAAIPNMAAKPLQVSGNIEKTDLNISARVTPEIQRTWDFAVNNLFKSQFHHRDYIKLQSQILVDYEPSQQGKAAVLVIAVSTEQTRNILNARWLKEFRPLLQYAGKKQLNDKNIDLRFVSYQEWHEQHR